MIRGRAGWRSYAMSTYSLSGCLRPCSRCRLRGSKARFLAGILNGGRVTQERGAAWSAVEPDGHGVFVACSVDGFNKDIVECSGCVFDVKIARVDGSAVVGRITLGEWRRTGMLVILSLDGAACKRTIARARNAILIMIIYLLCCCNNN